MAVSLVSSRDWARSFFKACKRKHIQLGGPSIGRARERLPRAKKNQKQTDQVRGLALVWAANRYVTEQNKNPYIIVPERFNYWRALCAGIKKFQHRVLIQHHNRQRRLLENEKLGLHHHVNLLQIFVTASRSAGNLLI
jgi:hypothetical protein